MVSVNSLCPVSVKTWQSLYGLCLSPNRATDRGRMAQLMGEWACETKWRSHFILRRGAYCRQKIETCLGCAHGPFGILFHKRLRPRKRQSLLGRPQRASTLNPNHARPFLLWLRSAALISAARTLMSATALRSLARLRFVVGTRYYYLRLAKKQD